MLLKQSKQIFQNKGHIVKIPTSRRQVSWLFTKRDRGLELGTTEKQFPLVTVGGLENGTSELQQQRPKLLGHAASRKITMCIFL